MIDSVFNQTYLNWELCIADGGSTTPGTKEMLAALSKEDDRIKIKWLKDNKSIAGNLNDALSLATGDYLAFIDHDAILASFALFEVLMTINETPETDFVYSDEDLISEDGKKRFEPDFKPDWSPDNLRSRNYIKHLTIIKKELLIKSGRFREGLEGSQDYDFRLRATESAKKVVHIPEVLYHSRFHKNSCAGRAGVQSPTDETAKKVLGYHLSRIGMEGSVENGISPGLYKVTFRINDPKVSIIIPNKDHADDLDCCIKSILNKSRYKNYEIIIVENGSVEDNTIKLYDELRMFNNIRIIKWEKPFNYSLVNNHAVHFAIGEVLLFLNNDTEVINHDWLERMLEHAVRKDVGAVGAKLYYPDDTIQHAGVFLGADGQVLHQHRFYPGQASGYQARLKFIQNVSAVTGACVMTRKEVFEEVGGFDERYDIVCGDIDFCLKLREKGYLVLWTPYAELYHNELKTRGYNNKAVKRVRIKEEEARFRSKWKNVLLKGDPNYNPNLTQEREDFSIRIK